MADIPEACIVDADPNDPQGTLDRAAAVFIAYGCVAVRYPGETINPMTLKARQTVYGKSPADIGKRDAEIRNRIG